MADPLATDPPDSLSQSLECLLHSFPTPLADLIRTSNQRAIPMLAKDAKATALVENLVRSLPTHHDLYLGDSRQALAQFPNESVHLIVTSPPYWNLKEYPQADGQLGAIDDFDEFLVQLARVWAHAYRLLVPGGRLVIVVGDVLVPRRRYGRHLVFPLHAAIQEQCRTIGLDNLAPIIWYKIGNAQFEAPGNSGRFLGKPYEPNGIVKNDIEYLLFQRKPGGYRQPTSASRVLSVLPDSLHHDCFQQIWTITGASTKNHPAPYPLTLVDRLIRMFSFVGDTVLDPFMGTGTTNLGAARWGRNSIGVDITPAYIDLSHTRLRNHTPQPTIAIHDVRI